MNRWQRATIKALSRADIDVKKNYQAIRKILGAIHPPLAPIYGVWDQIFMVGDREIPVRVFRPKEAAAPGVLLFFHGGGWVVGNIDSYTNICANMARETRRMVISVDYRLAPEHPFPAGLEDCYYVAKNLFENTHLLNCPASEIVLIGDSAGGNLAAAVSLLARERGEFSPARQILLYPATWHDHSPDSIYPSVRTNGTDYLLTSKRIQDYMDLYVPDPAQRRSPYVAPLLAEDLARQPATLIVTAEFDPLRDEGEAYGERLRAAGTPAFVHRIPDAIHGFMSFPPIAPEVQACYGHIRRFLEGGGGR